MSGGVECRVGNIRRLLVYVGYLAGYVGCLMRYIKCKVRYARCMVGYKVHVGGMYNVGCLFEFVGCFMG